MIQAEPIPAPITAQPRPDYGSFLDNIGVAFGFDGEGPMRRIVGLAVVMLVVSLFAFLIFRRHK